MTARHDDTRKFARFSLGLDSSGSPMQKFSGAHQANSFGKLWVTITYEGSHIEGLILTLAKASKKEVK